MSNDKPLDPAEAITKAKQMLEEMDKHLDFAQKQATAARFIIGLAMEVSQPTIDQQIKNQVYTEAMGNVHARIIEARTHIGVAGAVLSAKPGGAVQG